MKISDKMFDPIDSNWRKIQIEFKILRWFEFTAELFCWIEVVRNVRD